MAKRPPRRRKLTKKERKNALELATRDALRDLLNLYDHATSGGDASWSAADAIHLVEIRKLVNSLPQKRKTPPPAVTPAAEWRGGIRRAEL